MDTASKTPSNRRQSARARVAMAVKEQYPSRTLLSQASDISTDGIFLANVDDGAADLVRIPGSKCWLEFSLPGVDTTSIRARGQVVRQFKYQRYQLTAIHFASLAPSHRRRIQRYVSAPDREVPPPQFIPPTPYQ